jgi:two-component system sensor histidine kinase BaeS
MLRKIRYKMFLAILAANGLLLVVVYFSANWIFNTSFRDYLDQSEADRLQPLVQELALRYQQQGNWRWVRDRSNHDWPELMQRYVRPQAGPGRDRPPPPGGGRKAERPPREVSPGASPGPSAGPFGIQRKLMLRNANQRLVIGNPRNEPDAYWIAIESNNTVVGHLGFVRRINIGGDLDRLFAERVEKYLTWLLLGMLLITGLVAIPLAAGLVRPIERLRFAVRELASGNFDLSLDRHGNDEIGDLQLDFNRLAQTMRENLQARQRWIADISHELRTPVAVLQGELEAILDGVRDMDAAGMQSLHQEVLRLSRLVNDLHDLSLSDLGAMTYQNREIDLHALLRSVVEQQSLLHAADDISFEFTAVAEPMMIFADEQRLQQLFNNLANNSRFYSARPGKVQVSLTRSLARSGANACVEWSDSAPGVGDLELKQLFDRLYRVDASRARNSGGSGLGLSICKNIVEATQGSIGAGHSALGGVSIRITLPLSEASHD